MRLRHLPWLTQMVLGGAGLSVAAAQDTVAVARQPVTPVEVYGAVGDFATGDPVVGAFVKINGDVKSISRDDGTFRFALPPGRHKIEIRRIGYVARIFDVTLEESKPTYQLRVALDPVPLLLPEVVTEVDRTRLVFGRRREFYRRLRQGQGHFVTREDIELRAPQDVTELLRSIPGVEVYETGIDYKRIRLAYGRRGCEGPLVFLDGIRVDAPFIDALVSPDVLEAMEVYTRPVTVPPEFNQMGASCGVVVLWTR